MKTGMLAGGLGMRGSGETSLRPKAVVETGSQPTLWHLLKIYSRHVVNDFII
jgi:glucose-1-phosphate cytidylyltransferase